MLLSQSLEASPTTIPTGGLAVLMGSLAVQTGRPPVPMGSLARNVPGRGTNFLHRTLRTSTDFSVRLVPNLGATLGVGLGVGNTKENHLDNQRVKCWVCWVSPTVCQHVGARVYVFAHTYRQIAVRAGTGPTPTSDYKSQYSEYQAVATLGFDQPLP